MLVVGHIREVEYPEWLTNVVLAPKLLKFCMCVDYTDLNKACPIDLFPLPSPNQMVDEMSGCEAMSCLASWMLSRGTTRYSWH